MNNLIFSIGVFITIYLLYVIFVINKRDKLQKLKKGVIVSYIVKKYNLDLKKINLKVLGHMISLSIAFIISITFYIVSFVDNYVLKVLLSFVILMPFQLLIYNIIGILYKKEQKKQ